MTVPSVMQDLTLAADNLCSASEDWKARALSAEAALSEAFAASVMKVCDTRLWTAEMIDAWHRAMPDLPRAFQSLATVIQGTSEPATLDDQNGHSAEVQPEQKRS